MLGLLSFSCLFPLFLQDAACEGAPRVETRVGTIEGLTATNGQYYTYMGIPYAKVNSSNPFGPSIPYPPFEEPFEAYNNSAMCPQVYSVRDQIMGTLDCLNLNVYVPASANTSTSSFPVMVWIYGGGFQGGSAGDLGATYLVQHNVILVTMNYRTGPYGFMCLDIPEVPGNQGLKDQYIALKWVKDNIQAFGGDPNQITLAGHSAGGHSVNLHLVSSKEELFNRVILQSASNLLSHVLFGPDNTAPLKLASHLGFESNDTRDALDYLSGIDTDSVIAAAINLSLSFNPCKENHFDDVDPFLTTTWIGSKVSKVKNMPILMGFNELEVAGDLFGRNDTYFNNLTIVDDNLKEVFNFTDQRQQEMKDSVSHFYFGDAEIDVKLKWDVIRFHSDFTFIHPVHRSLQRYLDNGAGDIFFYMFSYVGGRNIVVTKTYDEAVSNGHLCCASHGDELGYLFNLQYDSEPTDADEMTIKRMTTMWTNFVKYGDPTPDGEFLIRWMPVTTNTYYYLNIDIELSLAKRPLRERMTYWDLFYTYNKNYQKGYEEE